MPTAPLIPYRPARSGMRTIYIQRSTEDADQDLTPENCADRFDLFITEAQGGLVGLAEQLRAARATA